jgi:membrane protease YdiL (CAAX protease family)
MDTINFLIIGFIGGSILGFIKFLSSILVNRRNRILVVSKHIYSESLVKDVIVFPTVEETIFRYYILTTISALISPLIGLASSSILFGYAHVGCKTLNQISHFFAFSAKGAIFGWCFLVGGFWSALIAHSISNFVSLIILSSPRPSSYPIRF